MSLKIDQTYAKIGIETSPARMEIQKQSALLELHSKQPKIDMHTELLKIEIDQYKAFASAGLKNYIDLTKEAAQRAYQQVMEYIGKTAEDGDRLAAIELGGNPIADIAERDAFPEHEFIIDAIPSEGPRFNVRVGTVKFTPENTAEGAYNGVEGKYIPGSLELKYTPAKVNIYMKQYPSISIKYEGKSVDVRI